MGKVASAAANVLARDDGLKFAWPYFQEILRWCRCIVDSTGIEVVPPVPPVRAVRAYREATHRMFMSATLADDSVLVRELGCDHEAALNPIAPAPGSFGERLVLVPSLIDAALDLKWVRQYCANISKKWNVAVLCSSKRDALLWKEHGAMVVVDDDVATAVKQLRAGTLRFVAFANRYDGVDLPDDACRVLVLDGLPAGQGIAASHDSGIRGSFQHRVAYRIEQGMGRAVRSNADYAVVILAGPSLASFTAKPEVRQQMSADARAQIELAHSLPSLAKSSATPQSPQSVCDSMIHQCLTRSDGWRAFYEDRVRRVVALANPPADRTRIAVAQRERKAAECAYSGDSVEAARNVQEILNEHLTRESATGNRDRERARAFYAQTLAFYLHDTDPGRGQQAQVQAHDADPVLLRPSTGFVKRRLSQESLGQAALASRHYSTFDNPNAYLAAFEAVRSEISFEADARRFERAVCDIAAFLGIEGSRPEHDDGEGPDALLAWPALVLVVEAKNESHRDLVPKKDAEQLLHSMRWFEKNYPAKARIAAPVIVARATSADPGVHMPDGSRVITPGTLEQLLTAAAGFAKALAQKPHMEWEPAKVRELLDGHALTQERFIATYSVPFR